MGQSERHAEIYLGLFVVAGLAVLGWLMFQVGESGGRPRGGYPLFLEVRDAGGIRAGVPVRLGGVDIGEVAAAPSLSEDFTTMEIEMRIWPGLRVPEGSRFRVASSGLMGDRFIRIDPPGEGGGGFHPEGARLQGDAEAAPGDLAGGVEALVERALEAVEEVSGAAVRANEVFVRLDAEVLSEANVENLAALLAELRESSERLGAASMRLEPLLDETSTAARSLTSAAGTAEEAFVKFGAGVDEANAALARMEPVLGDFDETLALLRSTLQAANGLIHRIERGDGLAAALVNDSELKRDLESFVEKVERHGILLYPRESGLLGGLRRGAERAAERGAERGAERAAPAGRGGGGEGPLRRLKP